MSLPGQLPQWLDGNKDWVRAFPGTLIMKEFGAIAKPAGNLTVCIDPRCAPEKFFGAGFDGPVFRNAGGRPTWDAVRSILVLRSLVGSTTVAVVHHTDKHQIAAVCATSWLILALSTDCGITNITDEQLEKDALERTPDAQEEIKKVLFSTLAIKEEDFEKVIKEDIKTLRGYKVLAGMEIVGLKLNTFTGAVEIVDV